MRWLTIDPGETTGWAVFDDDRLVDCGQTPLWDFLDQLWLAVGLVEGVSEEGWTEWGAYPLTRIVCEDWALYPWSVKALSWDKCRTARGIGAIELMARQAGVELVLQPAKIKEAATAAGAEELFVSPLHENRHANDAIMHGVYWLTKNGQ